MAGSMIHNLRSGGEAVIHLPLHFGGCVPRSEQLDGRVGATANTRSIVITHPVNRSQLMNDTSGPRTVFLTDLERAVGVENHTQRMVLEIPA